MGVMRCIAMSPMLMVLPDWRFMLAIGIHEH